MYQLIRDVECNKCGAIYKSNEREMTVQVGHVFLSICPKCTDEVAGLMGLDKDTITEKLAQIKYAETEANKKWNIDNGLVCKACGMDLERKVWRVRQGNASNIPAYHVECFKGVSTEK